MAAGLLLVLIIGVLVVGALVFLFLKLAPGLKGDIALHLGNTSFGPGQEIVGTVTVTAKKPLGPGRLIVSLVGIEEWEEWETDHDGDRTRRSRQEEIYRHDIELTQALSLNPGDRHDAAFVLPTPQPQDSVSAADDQGWIKALKVVAEAFGDDRETYWQVIGRYDIKGLDLNEAQRVPLRY